MVVRQDLPLGVVCAQCVHAAGESSAGNLPPNTVAVVLAVANQAKLLALERDLLMNGVAFKAIREPDPPYLGALMALGLSSTEKMSVYPFVKNLSLLKELI